MFTSQRTVGGGEEANCSVSSYSATSTVCTEINRINAESGQIFFMPSLSHAYKCLCYNEMYTRYFLGTTSSSEPAKEFQWLKNVTDLGLVTML